MVEPTLELIQAMLQRVLDSLREHSAEFREIKSRLSQIEHAIGGLHRDNAVHSENAALLNARMDRLSDRLARVERRLEIGEA